MNSTPNFVVLAGSLKKEHFAQNTGFGEKKAQFFVGNRQIEIFSQEMKSLDRLEPFRYTECKNWLETGSSVKL